ncbi:MAG: hypothetical protein QOJ63_1220 [Solirubrobacteraceae bacterium]|jgi:hypothetical protein|nr:hypothetical protein [Solirubrobacteraceae bacterium]
MLASLNRRRARPALILAAITSVGVMAHAPAAPASSQTARSASAQRALPGPRASVDAKLRAYAKRCASLGSRAEARVKGSDAAQCLDAMARLGSGQTRSARAACRGVNRKHVKGRYRSAHATCVIAASKLARDKRGADRKSAGGPGDPAVSKPGAAPADPDVLVGADLDPQAAIDAIDPNDPDARDLLDGVLDPGLGGEDPDKEDAP